MNNNFIIALILLIASLSLLIISIAGQIGFDNLFSKKKDPHVNDTIDVPYKIEPKENKKEKD
jgi:hypothetical protein